MNWFFFGLDMAMSTLFALLRSGVIPPEKYREFRALAILIIQRLPDDEFKTISDEVEKRNVANLRRENGS